MAERIPGLPSVASMGKLELPRTIRLADYPELKLLAWHIPGARAVTPEEAFSLYTRNWRHTDRKYMHPHELALLDLLIATLGKGEFHGYRPPPMAGLTKPNQSLADST